MSWTRREADQRREEILAALRAAGGNVSRAAEAIGCSRQTLYSHATRLGLQRAFGLRDPGAPEPVAAPETRRAVTVKLPELLWRWTRHAAIDQGRTVSGVVELALERLRAGDAKGKGAA